MDRLKYKVIKSEKQYNQYSRILQQLVEEPARAGSRDEIELLTVLIHQYDEVQDQLIDLDPIELLKSFMSDHQMNGTHLVDLLGISKGYVSDILNYKKGLSKEVIRKLALKFKVRQEAFNRPYALEKSKKKPGLSATA